MSCSIFDRLVNKTFVMSPTNTNYSKHKLFVHFTGDFKKQKLILTEMCGANESLFESSFKFNRDSNRLYITKAGNNNTHPYTWMIFEEEPSKTLIMWLYRPEGHVVFRLE